MITETAWYNYLLTLNSADEISREIVKEIEAKNKLPFDLFTFYGLNADTITQSEYENLCNKLATLKQKQ